MSPTVAPYQTLAVQIDAARAHTDRLFELLQPRALYSRPIPERHRLIFYLGHLEAFDWNQICRSALQIPSFHPEFDRLFEFGIDPPVGQAPQDQPSDWPDAAEVHAYNRRVRAALDEVLDRAPEQMIQVALEHRWMHAETFAYLLHHLPYSDKAVIATDLAHSVDRLQSPMIEIPAGSATLGQQSGEFGWDNEFGQHSVDVPPFSIGKYKITNDQYLDFVRDGAAPPHFWMMRGREWFYRGVFQEFPLPPNAPVYVTHAEAAAYAKWAGKQLPTEAQYHRAAYGTADGYERPYPWGHARPRPSCGNFDFYNWSPMDVNATPDGDSAFGVSQTCGNGWEWTSTVFGPFAGFEPFSFYPGYSANFFDGSHYVIKGGSQRTAARLLRRSFRNWFRPDYPYVYAGFRLTEN